MRAELIAEGTEQATRYFHECWQKHIVPPRKRKPSEWAEEVRWIPAGGPLSSGKDGLHPKDVRFSHEHTPHILEPEDSADDPSVRVIVLWMGVREAKTTVALNIIGRCVTDSPGGIYSVHPRIDDVEKFSADDAEPMIELSPELAERFVKKKSRDSGRTIAFKKFAGGSWRIVSAGEITAFRGSTVKVLCLHEADALEVESIYKAFGRTTGLSDAVIVMESTCTSAATEDEHGKKVYHSVIHEWYEKGDQRKWFCQCKHCAKLNVIYYKDFASPGGVMAHTEYICPRCAEAHNERDWYAMSRGGIWFPTAGLSKDQCADIEHESKHAKALQPEVRSYWRNGFTSLLPKGKGYVTKLHEFVSQGEAAKSSIEALKTWTNEVAAELWDANLIGENPPEWQPLRDRAEDYSTVEKIVVPAGGLVLAGGGDVQKNRIEWTWIAFGREEAAWVIDHMVIDGETDDHSARGPWAALKRELQRTFAHERGGKMALEIGMIDAGFRSDDVLKFLQTNPASGRLRACKGASTYPAPVVSGWGQIVKGRRGEATLWGHFVGTDIVKDTLYSRLRLVPMADGSLPDGWIHFGKRLPQSYYEQLTAERVEINIVNGHEERRYRKKSMARNETHDTFVYAYASFRRRRAWDFDAIESELRKNEEPEEPEEEIERMVTTGRSGFGRGWSL